MDGWRSDAFYEARRDELEKRVLEYLFDLSVGELAVMRQLEPPYVLRLKFVCSGEKDDDEEYASYGMVQCFIHHLLKLRLNMQMESGLCPEIY